MQMQLHIGVVVFNSSSSSTATIRLYCLSAVEDSAALAVAARHQGAMMT